MRDFGLVVIGAHFGVWLKDEIEKFKDQNILLVEPVPYNYEILKENFQNKKNFGFLLLTSFKKKSPSPFCLRLVFLKYFFFFKCIN